MSLNEKHPYLTAWFGFVVFMSISALVGGLLFSSILPSFVFFIYYCIIGFFVFQALIRKHIVGNISTIGSSQDGFSAKYPYLTAWLGFLVIQFIPTIIIDFLVGFIPNSALSIITNLLLWTIVNFFVFKFVVIRHIESRSEWHDTIGNQGI